MFFLAESPSQDETQEDDDVAEEFDNDHNDVPSDDESELDTADDLEALGMNLIFGRCILINAGV